MYYSKQAHGNLFFSLSFFKDRNVLLEEEYAYYPKYFKFSSSVDVHLCFRNSSLVVRVLPIHLESFLISLNELVRVAHLLL